MALADTLTLANLWDALHIRAVTFHLPENIISDTTGGGEQLTAARGVRLWTASVELATDRTADVAARDAALASIRTSGRALFVSPWPLHFPPADPTGALLGAAVPKLAAVAANNRDINISSLPANYVIAPGTFLSFSYGSNPTRYALHQVVVGKTASGAGLATAVEVTPPLRPGWAVNANIAFKPPVMRATYTPGSYAPPQHQLGGHATGGGFSLTQTLR